MDLPSTEVYEGLDSLAPYRNHSSTAYAEYCNARDRNESPHILLQMLILMLDETYEEDEELFLVNISSKEECLLAKSLNLGAYTKLFAAHH